MNEIEKYLETLKQFGVKKLKEYFDIGILDLNDFDLVNSFLIYQSVTKNKNLLIYLPDKLTKSQFYIPVILTLSLYEFVNNYIDNENVFEVGDILQKDGLRYEITNIDGDNFVLQGSNVTKYPTLKQIKKNYILTNGTLTGRKVKTKFNTYKNFFTKTLKLQSKEELPSKFKHKSIIVTDKKIVDELKKYQIDNEKIHKAFPFRYITSTGNSTDNIPIDPMIYIVNSYDTAKKHIINKDINIKNIIFIGANKYQDILLNLSNDIANNIFENIIFIGSLDIQQNTIPNLLKWKWTLPEFNHYKYFETKPIKLEIVSDEIFDNKLKEFNELIKLIEREYNIKLTKIYSFVKKLFPITIPNESSRLIKQLDYLLDSFGKEGEEFIEDEFYEIDEYDYEATWEKIYEKFKSLVEYKKTNFKKFELLNSLKKVDYLIVPKDYINIWKEETHIKNIISFGEFKEFKKKYNPKEYGKPNVVFLGFYGYEHLKEIIYNEFNVTLILNSIEKQSFDYYKEKLETETLIAIKESDRKSLAEISFKQTETNETIPELLERLFLKNKETNYKEYDYSNIVGISLNYELEFENGEVIILDENKTVLLQTNNNERPEKIKNIKEGDKIRVYENSSIEKLYKIALKADKKGHFKKIELASKIWKNALSECSKKFESISDFFIHLKETGISITNELTLKNWIKIESNVKFPQRKKDLKVIRKVCENKEFNEKFSMVLSARSSYNGIMIALGRDLSNEITDFIKFKKKGSILKRFSDEQINEMINQNAPLKTVKSIKLSDDEN